MWNHIATLMSAKKIRLNLTLRQVFPQSEENIDVSRVSVLILLDTILEASFVRTTSYENTSYSRFHCKDYRSRKLRVGKID